MSNPITRASDTDLFSGGVRQKQLAADQIEAFYHDEFVEDQVRDFAALAPDVRPDGVVVDMGGGCGFFAGRLAEKLAHRTRVVDMDPASVEACRRAGVEAVEGDALNPVVAGDEDIVCFNLILHHLVAGDETGTRALQIAALRAWRGHARAVIVNEYIYQSYIGYLSGRLIYAITGSALLSWLGQQVARVIPAFRANTFGVGVRFRAHEEWLALFREAGFRVVDKRIGRPEPVAPPLRLLMIRTIRRDSFRLEHDEA